eukprot:353339-Chlamydomonas_euryale.AAC.1
MGAQAHGHMCEWAHGCTGAWAHGRMGHVAGVHGACGGGAWGMRRECMGHVAGVHGACDGSAWGMWRGCMGHAAGVHGACDGGSDSCACVGLGAWVHGHHGTGAWA